MITLRKVTLEDKRILRNLFSYFIHDLAKYEDARIDKNGFFDNPDVEHVIKHRGHHAFFIMCNHEIAGFVTVTRPPYHSKDRKTTVVQHFFVLNGYRRKSIGSEAFLKVLRRFPGKYAVGQLRGNRPAIKFWRTVLRRNGIRYTEGIIHDPDQSYMVQRFRYRRRTR